MKRITATLVEGYQRDDWVQNLVPDESRLVIDRWLRASVPKRMVFAALYGDIIKSRQNRRVLDVGGGVSSLTPWLCRTCGYCLIDILAHGGVDELRGWEVEFGQKILIEGDWYNALDSESNYDVIIANDLFPNSDQRLELFLERALPLASEIRLSLTFYNHPRFYMCRRIDADEFLCLLAWTGRQTASALERFADRIIAPNLSVLEGDQGSVYSNGRHVALATLRGYRNV
jgi:hypothetical protein